eukprot:2660121-Rhodomonas_salina.3
MSYLTSNISHLLSATTRSRSTPLSSYLHLSYLISHISLRTPCVIPHTPSLLAHISLRTPRVIPHTPSLLYHVALLTPCIMSHTFYLLSHISGNLKSQIANRKPHISYLISQISYLKSHLAHSFSASTRSRSTSSSFSLNRPVSAQATRGHVP